MERKYTALFFSLLYCLGVFAKLSMICVYKEEEAYIHSIFVSRSRSR
ncbi:hypothetical protein HMPREF0083_00403 [Aneurinibacillus aneurinilyticus ATCC 12856]|uniref:Uncharacterized protein n=1 Tax=Aneurinibacillus aneurinilyticus ATCC 12856 TaxID=649747 RepID=U1X971_ANEAE|nr:hypothetical protein HMPREF0083_00403 [Aneurinibacillus aneurinilyticus ATCC 12856]